MAQTAGKGAPAASGLPAHGLLEAFPAGADPRGPPAGRGRTTTDATILTVLGTGLTAIGTGVALFVALWRVQGNRFEAAESANRERFEAAESANRERFKAAESAKP